MTKETLQKNFPKANIHYAKFTHSEFFLLVQQGVSFHVSIEKNHIETRVFNHSIEQNGLLVNNEEELIHYIGLTLTNLTDGYSE